MPFTFKPAQLLQLLLITFVITLALLNKTTPAQALTNTSAASSQLASTSQLALIGTGPDVCVRAGCSHELCVSSNIAGQIMSPCVFKEENECLSSAVCERQTDGNCGFTTTAAYQACLAGIDTSTPPASTAPGPASSPPTSSTRPAFSPLPPIYPPETGTGTRPPVTKSPLPSPVLPPNSDSCTPRPLCLQLGLCKMPERSDYCPPNPGQITPPFPGRLPPGCRLQPVQCIKAPCPAQISCLDSLFTSLPGDLNQDGVVNIYDFLELKKLFLRPTVEYPLTDLNQDGKINLIDYSLLTKQMQQ